MREASPQSSGPPPARGGCGHLNLSPAGACVTSPRTPVCFPQPLAWLRDQPGSVRPQSTGFRHHGSGKLFAQLAGGGLLGRGPRKPASGTKPWLPRRWSREVPRARAVGSRSTLWTRKKAVGRSVSRVGTPGKNQNGPLGLSGKK